MVASHPLNPCHSEELECNEFCAQWTLIRVPWYINNWNPTDQGVRLLRGTCKHFPSSRGFRHGFPAAESGIAEEADEFKAVRLQGTDRDFSPFQTGVTCVFFPLNSSSLSTPVQVFVELRACLDSGYHTSSVSGPDVGYYYVHSTNQCKFVESRLSSLHTFKHPR